MIVRDSLQYLENIVPHYVLNDGLRRICLDVVADPRFQKAPGSAGKHHGYEGGLLQHTAEVVESALSMTFSVSIDPRVDREVLTTAAVFHDFCKIHEYLINPDGPITKMPYRNLVRHVSGSHAAFLQAVSSVDVPAETVLQIEHCILAHHGRFEWGSPVEPQTPEASILHFADMLSAGYGVGKNYPIPFKE